MPEKSRPFWYQTIKRWQQSDLPTAILCLLPALIILGMFNIFPILYSGYLSLLTWDGMSPDRVFAGLEHYQKLLRSAELWNSLSVTFYYMVGVTVLGLAVSLIVALVLNSGLRGLAVYRTIYFIPVVTSTIAAAVVWKYLFAGSGVISTLLRSWHLPAPNWLSDPQWAMPVIILLGVWKRLGFNMVIYLAGLQGIPQPLYDAAKVDGAGWLARFWYVTLPLLMPITLLLTIMSVIDSFLVFDQVFVMTNGGPLESTEVIGLLLYRRAFRYFELGEASAIGWIIFAFVFIVTLIQWRFLGEQGTERAL